MHGAKMHVSASIAIEIFNSANKLFTSCTKWQMKRFGFFLPPALHTAYLSYMEFLALLVALV